MDLDIGCRAHPGPLLHFETILPVTKPVGVSNDLMFSAPKTPFMDLVINSLETFNHEWLYMPYPTVMFSTGPMFISAIYSMWSRILEKGIGIEPPSQTSLYKRVRILPKPLYGKNAAPEEVPDSFFWHYYGSSWHAGDAGFVGFVSVGEIDVQVVAYFHEADSYLAFNDAALYSLANMDIVYYCLAVVSCLSVSATWCGPNGIMSYLHRGNENYHWILLKILP